MPNVEHEGHRIFYHDTGAGRPLVLLHNGFYSTMSWNGIREALSSGFRVLDYDRYGYGQSTHLPGDPLTGDLVELGVEELTAFSDALGLERFDVVGHCLGGAIALLFAVRNPDRVGKVVAEAVGYYGDFRSLIKTDMTFVPFERIEKAIRKKMTAMHGESYSRILWSVFSNHRESYIMSETYDIRDEVARLKAPLLMINGDRDFYFDVAHPMPIFKRLRKNARLWIAPNCGHDIHMEIPEDFIRNVTAFLE